MTTPAVSLRPVQPPQFDQFLAMFDNYRRELERYDPDGPDRVPLSRYGEALRDDEHDIRWIEEGGQRAGFLVLRMLDDWPGESREIAEIAEFYVLPERRRSGLGAAAVAALLADLRARGITLVEASILEANGPARTFWAAQGFTARSIRTARTP